MVIRRRFLVSLCHFRGQISKIRWSNPPLPQCHDIPQNIEYSLLIHDLKADTWDQAVTSKSRRNRYLLKGGPFRRCDEMIWGFDFDKSRSRETVLYNLVPWQVAEYRKAMDTRISRSKAKRSALAGVLKKSAILETLYWISEKVGFSFVLVLFGSNISLGNFNMLERRLISICGNTSMMAHHLAGDGTQDELLREYFELLDEGRREGSKTAKTYLAGLKESSHEELTGGLEVELQDVSFTYPSESLADPDLIVDNAPFLSQQSSTPNAPALQNCTFKFERGKLYSIVGQNGAGKTTLVQVLARIYDPDSGTILVNGKNILEYDPKDIQSNISVLFQDFARFEHLTARETIEVGHLNDPNRRERAERLAVEAGVTGFVSLDAVLTDISSQARDSHEQWQSDLSGGQWQKIGLARAFMRDDASLLILDEPTSALDVEAEHEFFKQIRARRRGKTTIFITHKFNTTKTADCVLFMKEGKVLEAGSHDELLKLNGEYARLYKIQSEGYNHLK